jgi:hypothetical protein
MSTPPQAAAPLSAAQAMAMVRSGLAFLVTCEASALPTATQAETLVGLERAEGRLTAARSMMLAAFCAGHGYEADGQYGPKPWLRAFTHVTKAAASGAVSWMRRLTSHPAVAAALAAETITTSWAREICAWTDRLPVGLVEDADRILLAAAAGGADLPDLAMLAMEMVVRARTTPDSDEDSFADRAVWLETTLAGAGRLTGDLTPACTAALTAILDALAAKAGPEDTRSLSQRRHDALEEACHRLIAADMVPGRDGDSLRVYAHLDLARLTGPPSSALGASPLESRWSLARAAAGPGAWCPTGPDAEAAACDTTVIPVVTGQVDWALLDELISLALPAWPSAHGPSSCARPDGPLDPPAPSGPISPATRQRLRDLALQHAVSLLSGPAGLAAQSRARALGHPLAGPGQVLDLGAPTPVIPTALRRAVALRDQRCRFPGCAQPPSVCQVHHLIPRAREGPTALPNLALLCRFHHLTVIHRWGWTLTCHPDGTTTATGPDSRTLHSHSPPQRAA